MADSMSRARMRSASASSVLLLRRQRVCARPVSIGFEAPVAASRRLGQYAFSELLRLQRPSVQTFDARRVSAIL